ncbi:hypothetical protein ACJJTC_014248 [Scirpophaga incertulas]
MIMITFNQKSKLNVFRFCKQIPLLLDRKILRCDLCRIKLAVCAGGGSDISKDLSTSESIAGRLQASCIDHLWVRTRRERCDGEGSSDVGNPLSDCDTEVFVLECNISDHYGIGISLNIPQRIDIENKYSLSLDSESARKTYNPTRTGNFSPC